MLPIIGLIVATYALARLVQAPIAHNPASGARVWLVIISGVACAAILWMTWLLISVWAEVPAIE